MLFTDTSGDFAGRIFAIVDGDGDGDGAYQAGTDYVFEFLHPVVPPDSTSACFI